MSPRRGRRTAELGVLIALTGLLPGCITVSQSVRPHTLEEGELRLGVTGGLSRALGYDVEYARPQDANPEEDGVSPLSLALLQELSAHYGVRDDLDVGLRLRLPYSPAGDWNLGLKLETMLQLFDQHKRQDPVSLAIGVGLDGFFRPYHGPNEVVTEVRTSSPGSDESYYYPQTIDDGGFDLQYGGAMLDFPLILAYRPDAVIELFMGGRVGFLYIDATQRYEPADPGFATVEYTKEVRQPTFGGFAGFTLTSPLKRFRASITPQLYFYTLDIPDYGQAVQVGGTVDLGYQF